MRVPKLLRNRFQQISSRPSMNVISRVNNDLRNLILSHSFFTFASLRLCVSSYLAEAFINPIRARMIISTPKPK